MYPNNTSYRSPNNSHNTQKPYPIQARRLPEDIPPLPNNLPNLPPISPESNAAFYSLFPDAIPCSDKNAYIVHANGTISTHLNYHSDILPQNVPPPPEDPTHFPTYEEFLEIAREGGILFPEAEACRGTSSSGYSGSRSHIQSHVNGQAKSHAQIQVKPPPVKRYNEHVPSPNKKGKVVTPQRYTHSAMK